MSLIQNNIRFLRRQKELTQGQLGEALGIARARIGAYEEGRAEPNLPLLQKMAALFNVTLDELISKDLSESPPPLNPAPALLPPTDLSGKKLRVLSITVDNQDRENVELVPQKAAAGYLNGYADPEYLEQLPRFRLPMLPPGTYRAFEISGDSMLPLTPGTIVIGQYVENWNDIRNGQTYVLVTTREGVVYKRVINRLLAEGVLTLHSDNPAYDAYEVDADDLLEVWSARAYISMNFPDSNMNLQKLTNIVMELQKEVIRLKG
jgi:transcriptional regulator with XRE-family HTH domain